jgi:hypothetical protein
MASGIRPLHKSAFFGFLVLLVASALAVDEAFAQSPEWSDAQLVAYSRAILTGRVLDVASALDPVTGGIYTYVTLEVGEVAKGAISGGTLTLKQLGGEVGEIGLGVGGQARFGRGEEVLVFLEQRTRDNTLYTTALWQGKWTIARGGGPATAIREHEGYFHAPPGAQAAPATVTDSRLLDVFLAELRAWSDAGEEAGGVPFVTRPAETPAITAGEDVGGAPFNLFSPPWRYHEADTATAVPVDILTGGMPGLSGGGFTEIGTARGLWNNSGASISLGAGNTTSFGGCFANSDSNGRIRISFMDPCGEIDNSGGTLAIGGSYYSLLVADQKTVNSTVFNKGLRGMIVNNGDSSNATPYLTNSRCFQDIQTHEAGHVIGLAHSGNAAALMAPFIDNNCLTAFTAPDESGGGAITGALHQDDKDGAIFIYPLATPTAATLVSPIGNTTTTDNTPTYTWNAVSGATWYYLWVYGPTSDAYVIQQWFSASSAGCSSGICSVTPSTALFLGDHDWWIRTWNAAGNGPWSSRGDFSVVSSSPPVAATLVSPINNAVTADNTPTYTWNAVNGSTWYYLWVDLQGGGNVIKQWYTAAGAGCPSGTGTCSVTHATVLADGNHDWWIKTWNSNGNGPWSSRGDFSVATSVPAAPTLIYPTGGVDTPSSNPNFQWNAVSGATWYYIWVDGPTGFLYTQWVTATQAGCPTGTGTCAFGPTQTLTQTGTHKWWVKGWNATGHGPYSSAGVWNRTALDDDK